MRLNHMAILAMFFVSATALAGQDERNAPVTRSGYEAHLHGRFAKIDLNEDGFISSDEAKRPQMISKFDADRDGKVSLDEYRMGALARFDSIDANKDGVVTAEEKAAAFKAHYGTDKSP